MVRTFYSFLLKNMIKGNGDLVEQIWNDAREWNWEGKSDTTQVRYNNSTYCQLQEVKVQGGAMEVL